MHFLPVIINDEFIFYQFLTHDSIIFLIHYHIFVENSYNEIWYGYAYNDLKKGKLKCILV